MIPAMNIIAWSQRAPWAEQRQVEQDLIISRALVEIFSDDFLRAELRFRGGTALNKLHFPAPICSFRLFSFIKLWPICIKMYPIAWTISFRYFAFINEHVQYLYLTGIERFSKLGKVLVAAGSRRYAAHRLLMPGRRLRRQVDRGGR